MYTTTVRTRKILEDKIAFKIFTPLIIWVILMFTTFLIAVKINPFVIVLMFIIFFTIIPICHSIYKKTDEFRGKKSLVNKEVTFNVVNGELYVDNKKMNVIQSKSKKKIYIDDIMTYEGKYGIKTKSATFIGTIEEPHLNGFINFLNEQGVKIHKN